MYKHVVLSISLIFLLAVPAEAVDVEKVSKILGNLNQSYSWVESYELGKFDCSTQTATLWHILKKQNIDSMIVASIYFDKKTNAWKDHIFLIAELDGCVYIIDATALEIRPPLPYNSGHIITRLYMTPEAANRAWPGEFIAQDIEPMKITAPAKPAAKIQKN